MRLVVKCDDCGSTLVISDCVDNLGREMVLKVTVCGCKHKDEDMCKNCEDLAFYRNLSKEQEQQLKRIREILVYAPEAEEKSVAPEAEEKSEPPDNSRALQPTPDVVSTGGCVIPGVKEGSAKDTKGQPR